MGYPVNPWGNPCSIYQRYGESSGTYPVYNILGSTDKISQAQMNDLIVWRSHMVQFAKLHPHEVYINGPNTEKKVSITFDDGPDSVITPKVLDIFNANNIKANFFFLGSQISYFPSILKRAFNEGHLVSNHSLNHPYFTKIDSQSITSQVIRTEEIIRSITGKRPAILRPPYGAADEKVLSSVRRTNNKITIWSIDSMDWVKNIDIQNVISNVLNNVRPGDIVLMHSGPGQGKALKALPEIIAGLNKKAFKIVRLDELLGINPYK
jgi:peptidoglycan/xylan/chitin deacetylase (PgdA/CDA1 family)